MGGSVVVSLGRLGACALLLLLYTGNPLWAQWMRQDLHTDCNLMDVHFADVDNGWIVGLSSTILHTSDGGATWIVQDAGDTNRGLYGVFAISSTTCWAVGQDTAILKTVDGGKNWEHQYINVDFQAKWQAWSVVFTDSVTGWISGDYQELSSDSSFILKTTDAGLSWQKSYHKGCDGARISAVDNQHLWLRCQICYLLRTQDGYNWTAIPTSQGCGSSTIFADIDFVSRSFGWATYDMIVNTSSIRRSFDGGLSWEGLLGGECILGSHSRISAVDSLHAWMVWYKFCDSLPLQIWKTSDGGVQWQSQLSYAPGPAQVQQRLFMIDTLRGWIVGDAGLVLHTTDGGATAVEGFGDDFPMQPDLGQNYPNPFNPVTKISYTLPKASHVRLKVYNVLGEEISSLVDEFKQPGTLSAEFDGSKLPSGMYFYRLTAGEFVEVRKMILIR